MARRVTVSLTVRVNDEAAALEAAAQGLLISEARNTIEEARAFFEGDVAAAVQFLCDDLSSRDFHFMEVEHSDREDEGETA